MGKTASCSLLGFKGLSVRHEHLLYEHGRPDHQAEKNHEAGKPGKGRGYYKSSLVVVDDVGYTPISREECNLFFRFIANRYEKSSTIITSNKAFGDWTELFHDPIIVTAIPDRLLHHSAVINIKGNSYRLQGKMNNHAKEEL